MSLSARLMQSSASSVVWLTSLMPVPTTTSSPARADSSGPALFVLPRLSTRLWFGLCRGRPLRGYPLGKCSLPRSDVERPADSVAVACQHGSLFALGERGLVQDGRRIGEK